MVVGIIIAIIVVIIVLSIVVSIKKKKERQALLDAVKKKDKETVQQLISKGVRADHFYYGEEKPISIAVKNNDIEMVSILLEKKTVLNYSPDNPLQIAIQNDQKDIVSLLIEKGADVNYEAPLCLISAIKNKNKEIVALLLEKGADVNYEAPLCLISAIKNKNKEIVALLLEKGALIDEQYHDETPLIISIKNDDKEILSLLLENDADPNFNIDEMPLDIAKKDDIIELLRNHGAKTKEEIEKIDSEFISAVLYLDKEKIKSLISQVSDIDIDISDGGESGSLKNVTALIFAVQNEEFELVRLFVENGAGIKVRDSNDASALFWAVFKGNVDIIDYLISKGADVDETFSRDGDENLDLLMLAASLGNIEVVNTLLKNGASVWHESKNGATAIAYAHSKGFTQVEALLEKAYRACFNV